MNTADHISIASQNTGNPPKRYTELQSSAEKIKINILILTFNREGNPSHCFMRDHAKKLFVSLKKDTFLELEEVAKKLLKY